MNQKARMVLKNRFTTAYYLAKKGKPFADYREFLNLQELNGLEVQKRYRADRAAAISLTI